MNTPENFLADEALDDVAAEWLCERDEGFSPERARAFVHWCESAPCHAAAVARVERALALLDEMPAVRAPLEARFGRVQEMGSEGIVPVAAGVSLGAGRWPT